MNSKVEDAERIENIGKIIEAWLSEQKLNRKLDIELILETIEKLENAEKDILSKFYGKEKQLTLDFKHNKRHSDDLKQFIRTYVLFPNPKLITSGPYRILLMNTMF